MKIKLYECKGGDQFDNYLVLDQDEVAESFDGRVLSMHESYIIVVNMRNGEFVGMPLDTEVELKDGP